MCQKQKKKIKSVNRKSVLSKMFSKQHWIALIYRVRTDTIIKRKVLTECKKDEKKRELLPYIRNSATLPVMPYEFAERYHYMHVTVQRDTEGYPYVYHRKKKRLYFQKNWSDDECIEYYRTLMCEQDEKSSHKYLTSDKRLPPMGAVIADVGAAEGIFTLDVIDRISKSYLFECDDGWVEPLKKTFENYMDKVEIISKKISNYVDDTTTTLDVFFQNKQIDFVKADIEGDEENLIGGVKCCF